MFLPVGKIVRRSRDGGGGAAAGVGLLLRVNAGGFWLAISVTMWP